ncbi:SLBB domain-containing protein [Gemmatimonas sp.]|jgi:protein involved in polysaccharide export with SLBB domain|uniref:SLBB domain-containing protein n=1 Tax=Gemmatimonas sp. TaxID=1962908 RepID=UPI0037BF9E13
MSRSRVLLALAASIMAGADVEPVHAQSLPANIPTPAQAQDLVQNRPELVAQLRQRIQASGLSADQLRARLRAAGYPESLLEQVMGGATLGASAPPSDSLISAVRTLGIVDSTDAAALRRILLGGTRAGAVAAAGTVSRLPTSGEGPEGESTRLGTSYASDGTTLFGYALFSQPTTVFDANAGGPVDASYKLGAGDQLVLILSGDVEAAYTLDVTREGFVVIPVVGTVPVANLTLGDLDVLLRARLQRVYSGIGRSTRFSVSVARLRSNQVFVVGDVQQPGSYRISSAGTALTALYAAGGPSERGSLRQVEIRRRGTPTQRFDVYAYLLRGDASGDVRLENGDVLFVPTHGARVRVSGGVLRPATYELRPNESLEDLVATAGGFTDDASRRRIRIQRIVPPTQRTAEGSDRIVLDVSLPDAATGTSAMRIPIEAGDVVEVPRVSNRVRGRITIIGNVWQPGSQGIDKASTLNDAIRQAGGLKSDSYLGRVIISRLRADSTREQIRATLRTDGTTTTPMSLQEDDEISVFSLTEFRAPQYVALSGAVRNPGQYAYRDGMTMRDLMLHAGGLLPSASLNEAEIARLPETRVPGQLAVTFRVPLDSSYVIDSPAAATPNGDTRLSPYDNVLVLRQPDWQMQSTVTLTGEVQFPGTYALTSKTERLSDVIARAGGLTASAYSAAVGFYRGEHAVGRVGVDLLRVLENPKDRDNLLLIDGDSVHVPRYNALVSVSGAVNSAVALPYEPGASLASYIRAAGGATRNADAKRAYVVQANGKVETRHRYFALIATQPKPRPGSRIIVPSRDPSDKRDVMQLLGTLTQVLGSLVTLAVVLSRTN